MAINGILHVFNSVLVLNQIEFLVRCFLPPLTRTAKLPEHFICCVVFYAI